MNKDFIKVEKLSHQYDERKILDNVSFALSNGDLLGIIGPNGAGKTTLIKNILGIIKPTSGEIYIDDEKILRYQSKELYKKIAFVPQESNFDFPLTVLETILLGRIPHSNKFHLEDANDYQIAKEALDSIEMSCFSSRMANQLSVGEKQLVSIAKALAQETNCIILDEPTSNLDISHAIKIMEKLKELSKNGKAVITVLHDLNLAARYCNKILILNKGAVTGFGNASEVLTESQINKVFDIEVHIGKSETTGNLIIEPVSTRH